MSALTLIDVVDLELRELRGLDPGDVLLVSLQLQEGQSIVIAAVRAIHSNCSCKGNP